MAKYLITGGCGFIGSHLADALVFKGHQVRILDNLSTGREENIPSQSELFVGTITDKNLVKQALKGVDGCFHLAAIVSVEQSIQQWSFSHMVNQSGTILLFETLAEMGLKIPVVYASSAAVYGRPLTLPLHEHSPLHPLSPYGVDKAAIEWQAALAWHLHRIPVIGCRLFNVFGLRQDASSPYSGVISRFVDRIYKGLPIVVFGNGEQKRDFIHVSDVVRFFIKAITYQPTEPLLFNLCTGCGTTINQLIALIENISQKKALKSYAPPRPGDIETSIGSCSRAFHFCSFKARMNLEEGLKELVKNQEDLCAGDCYLSS